MEASSAADDTPEPQMEADSPEDAQPELLYIAFIPKEGLPVVWGKIVAAVRKDSYLPEWAWEIAAEHGSVITLHMVKERALAQRTRS